jgi:hypothetical protein
MGYAPDRRCVWIGSDHGRLPADPLGPGEFQLADGGKAMMIVISSIDSSLLQTYGCTWILIEQSATAKVVRK